MKDYSTNYLESKIKNYRVLFIEFHDYERHSHLDINIPSGNNDKFEIINVACNQLGSEFKKADSTEPIKLQDEELQKQKIIDYIEESIAHGSNLIILPELSSSRSICNKIIKLYQCRNLAVLICYDATDFSTLMALQNYTDFIVCISCNQAYIQAINWSRS